MSSRSVLLFFNAWKTPKDADYWSVLEHEILDIQACKIAPHQKIVSLHALATDFSPKHESAERIFKEAEAMLYQAICGKSVAEVLLERADPEAENMGLYRWKSDRVLKQDLSKASNFLSSNELASLLALEQLFFQFVLHQAKSKQLMEMKDYEAAFLHLLKTVAPSYDFKPGMQSKTAALTEVRRRYDRFDAKRKSKELANHAEINWEAFRENLSNPRFRGAYF